ASGGQAVLSKIRAIRCEVRGTGYLEDKKIPLRYVWTYQGMDKSRALTFDGESKEPTETEVINGNRGWVKENGQPSQALSKEQLQSRLETAYVNWATLLVPLKGEGFR